MRLAGQAAMGIVARPVFRQCVCEFGEDRQVCVESDTIKSADSERE